MDALLVGAALMLVGAALLWIAWRGSQRRLPPNSLVGVRLPSTTGDERRWYAAQEAAAGPLGLGGGVAATSGLGVAATGLDTVGTILLALGLVALVAGVASGFVAGSRSARRAS